MNSVKALSYQQDSMSLTARPCSLCSRRERGGKRERRRDKKGQAAPTVSPRYLPSRWEHGVLAVLLLINTA